MISKTGRYGIRAMLALAQLPAGGQAGVSRIAELVDVPSSYLGKLLQQLVRAGLVNSQRGPGGGFTLARSADTISLYDVLEALEPIERWLGCFLGNNVCSEDSPCALHAQWKQVQQSYLRMLRQSTLAELVKRGSFLRNPTEGRLEIGTETTALIEGNRPGIHHGDNHGRHESLA